MAKYKADNYKGSGKSKGAYLKSQGKSSSKSSSSKKSSSKSSSKDEKKAKKQVTKYYGEKKTDVEQRAATDTKRLKEDLERIFAEAGIAKTRAMDDYTRNIGNIESNKNLDVQQLADYVSTNTTRTQEDLDTSLAKESRRFAIESDRINQDLAERGLTFSERKDERIAKEGSVQNVADIETEGARSFADIQRYEAAKNADIQLKYGQQTEEEGVKKTRTLEDILNEQQKRETQVRRGEEDVAFGKAIDLRELDYAKNDDLSDISNVYREQRNSLSNQRELTSIFG